MNPILPVLNYKLLWIVSSKENKKYLKFKEILKKEEHIKAFKERNLDIIENIVEDKDTFYINLYNIDMRLIESFNNFDDNENVINDIKKSIDKLSPPVPEKTQAGGKFSYKRKYYKYKQKYNLMKNVVTKFYFI